MFKSTSINGIFTAFKSECYVLTKSRVLWLLLLLPVAASFIKMTMINMKNIGNNVINSVNSGTETTITGYGFMVDGLSIGLITIYLLFLGFSAYTFAIDSERGVTRHSVVKSISRSELVMAKYFSLCLLAFISLAIMITGTCLIANLFWDLGPLIEEGYQIIGVDEIRKEILLGLKLAILPLPACLSFGLLFSVWARSAVQAVTLALGAGLLLDVFKPVLGNLQHYIFYSFQPSLIDHSYLKDVQRIVSGFSDVLIDNRIHQLNLIVPLPEALLLLIITIIVIHRRNL